MYNYDKHKGQIRKLNRIESIERAKFHLIQDSFGVLSAPETFELNHKAPTKPVNKSVSYIVS